MVLYGEVTGIFIPMTTDTLPRIVLVTGGNRGIGLAIAHAFKANGDTVIVSHRSGTAPSGMNGVIMDVTDPESITRAFKKVESTFGSIDILIANAGITKDGLSLRMSDDDFQSVVDTNLTGTFRTAQKVLSGMMKKKSGRVIFIGSVVGLLGSAGQVNHASTKSALVGMARSFAREYGSRNITFNVIAPGFVETDMTAQLSEELRSKYVDQIPLGRFCSPEEIAGVATFLASTQAQYITGAVIPVDGGLGMGH
jgi:3-oxoacyl-[acyl-carrier protein] reductase